MLFTEMWQTGGKIDIFFFSGGRAVNQESHIRYAKFEMPV